MENIRLISPAPEHERAAAEYVAEHIAFGEDHISGSGGMHRYEDYGAWLCILEQNSREETVEAGYVPATTFFGVREGDGRIVGMINIRHRLNDYLLEIGGHIGYGVRPSERGKGYATTMLALALAYCRDIGLNRVLITRNLDNPASGRVIEKNGGVFEDQRPEEDGTLICRYWIPI